MKHWLMVMIFVVCVIPALAVAANAPSLALDKTEYDFGDVQSGELVKTGFVVSNDGDAPLIIHDVRTSCGCTSAAAASRQIPAGGSTQVTVSYNSSGESAGSKTQGVVIVTNDPMQPMTRLQIHVNVVK
jgi:hypothetical protein